MDETPPGAAAAARRRLLGPADFLSLVRVPLAVAFPLVDSLAWRLAFVATAGVSDVLDGPIARRTGPSRAGAVIDPVADKAFTLSAFLTVAIENAGRTISGWELALVLLRDLAAVGGFFAVLALRKPVTVPARRTGKAVTVCQFATLVAVLAQSWLSRPLVILTAVVSVVAVVDYAREGVRLLRAAQREE